MLLFKHDSDAAAVVLVNLDIKKQHLKDVTDSF